MTTVVFPPRSNPTPMTFGAPSLYLSRSDNLASVTDILAARANLGVGPPATSSQLAIWLAHLPISPPAGGGWWNNSGVMTHATPDFNAADFNNTDFATGG